MLKYRLNLCGATKVKQNKRPMNHALLKQLACILFRSFNQGVLGLLCLYRYIFSPALSALFGISNKCRFYPTCSDYARQSFQTYGFFKASWLVFKRLLRCHPFSEGGYNPLP